MSKIFWIAALGTLGLVSCKNSQTASTVENPADRIAYIEHGEGRATQEGMLVAANMDILKEDGTELMAGSFSLPMEDSLWNHNRHVSIYHLIKDCREGDSIHFNMSAHEIFVHSQGRPVPPNIDSAENLSIKLGVFEVLDSTELVARRLEAMKNQLAQQKPQMEGQREATLARFKQSDRDNAAKIAEDEAVIKQYIADNNINATRMPNGTYMEYINTASGTESVAPFCQVTVNYIGTLLDGTVFDTSREDVAKENGKYTPGRQYGSFEHIVGVGRVIQGWDQSVERLSVGDRVRIFIPSSMGYGERGAGEAIPPNANLVFDIEVLSLLCPE